MCVNCNSSTTYSDPCGQYENCGCLNPTTFSCTTYTGPNLVLIAKKDDTGNVILQNIDNEFVKVAENKGKVLIDGNDSCPEYLFEKLAAGTNISFQIVGTGCDKKIQVNSSLGGVIPDINVKVSANDTSSGYLHDKIVTGSGISKNIIDPSGIEKVKIDVVPSALISGDAGNMLSIGVDGKIKTAFTLPDGSETKVTQGAGVTVSGTGTTADPYVVSTNPSIVAKRSCCDGIWKAFTIAAYTNPSVTNISNTVYYRYRHDGTIEFKGNMTFTVAFGAYSSAARKHTITIGSIAVDCITSTEQSGTSDLKGINYIDAPLTAEDAISQYGYIIRKSGQNLILEFQSSYSSATTKTVVVCFDGAVSHPSF